METKNELMLDEDQHRLLMCCRMARALDKGEIFLDATCHKMRWRLEKDGMTCNIFYSLDEMEQHFEHLIECRFRFSRLDIGYMDSRIRRRVDIIRKRHELRTNGTPMTFNSSINGTLL